MSGEPKKISFGFSKVSKKNAIIQPKNVSGTKNDVQYIDCLEEKSIKLINGENEEKKELPVIPMINGNLLRENLKDVIKSRNKSKNESENSNVSSLNGGDSAPNNEALTLDELATKEILEDLKKSDNKEVDETVTVPIKNEIIVNTNSSTLEDYENLPISDFGLAMLRGMGWDPKKGIGLNEKIVSPLPPSLRPKGMGLGADKVPSAKNVTSDGEVLILKKNAPLKIISGPYSNLYGKIEGFDELPGRILVRIASNNKVVSMNEIMVQLISMSELNKTIGNVENVRNIGATREQVQNNLSKESVSSISKERYGLECKGSQSHSKIRQNNEEDESKRNQSRKKYDSKFEISSSSESERSSRSRKIKKSKRKSSSSSESPPRKDRFKYSEMRKDHTVKYKESKEIKKKHSSSTKHHKRNYSPGRRIKQEISSSEESDYGNKVKKYKKGKHSVRSDSSSSDDRNRKGHHSRKHKKHYKR